MLTGVMMKHLWSECQAWRAEPHENVNELYKRTAVLGKVNVTTYVDAHWNKETCLEWKNPSIVKINKP